MCSVNCADPTGDGLRNCDVAVSESAEEHVAVSHNHHSSPTASPPDSRVGTPPASCSCRDEVCSNAVDVDTSPVATCTAVNTPTCETTLETKPAVVDVSLTPTKGIKTPVDTNKKTPRKARVSLAIQFMGVCTSQERCNTATKNTPSKCSNASPSDALLLKPSDFTSPSQPTEPHVATRECEVLCMKTDEMMAQVSSKSKRKPPRNDHDRVDSGEDSVSKSAGVVITQNCNKSGSAVNLEPECGETIKMVVRESQYCQERVRPPMSSEEEEEEGEGESGRARMGRSTTELEKFIALHQRNVHRNQVWQMFAWEHAVTLCMCV